MKDRERYLSNAEGTLQPQRLHQPKQERFIFCSGLVIRVQREQGILQSAPQPRFVPAPNAGAAVPDAVVPGAGGAVSQHGILDARLVDQEGVQEALRVNLFITVIVVRSL